MKTNKIILLSVMLITAVLSNEALAQESVENQTTTTTIAVDKVQEQSVKPQFSELGKPRALDTYWDRMAKCETGGNWKDKGKWSGGLGIYTQTWRGFGGTEFASKPEKATKEEQIIVANRISTQGYQTNDFRTLQDKLDNKPYFRNPVGFGGWGCMKHVGKPILFSKPPYKIYFRSFRLGERSERVMLLQKLIGARFVDGHYGPLTKKLHQEFVAKNIDVITSEYNRYSR
jgi:hypothetical protein